LNKPHPTQFVRKNERLKTNEHIAKIPADCALIGPLAAQLFQPKGRQTRYIPPPIALIIKLVPRWQTAVFGLETSPNENVAYVIGYEACCKVLLQRQVQLSTELTVFQNYVTQLI
jgi:hypothetical protein